MRTHFAVLPLIFSLCALAQTPPEATTPPEGSPPRTEVPTDLPVAEPAAPAPAARVEPPAPEGCRPLTEKAMAADLKALTAQSQKLDAALQLPLYTAASALWTKATEQCDGRARERAQRNLAENQKAMALLNEHLSNAPECASAHKDAGMLQELARAALGERRWLDAAVLFHKSEDMWDLAVDRCTGSQKELASKRLEQSEIDGYNAEFCAPLFDRARDFTQKLRASVPGMAREEKNDGLMVAETLWREAKDQCKGTAAQETARNNAQALARERGTPWVAKAPPAGSLAPAPAPPKPPTSTASTSASTLPSVSPAEASKAAAAAPAPAKTVPATTPELAVTVSSPAALTNPSVNLTSPAPKAKTGSSMDWYELATPAPATPSVPVTAAPSVGPLVQAALIAQKVEPAAKPEPVKAQPEPQPESFQVGDMRFKGKFVRDVDSPTFTGNGLLSWANGDVYEGSLQKGKRHGKGRFVWANGQRYEGEWVNDIPTGQAVVDFANGNHYEGPVIDSVPEGQGRMVYASGDIYTGRLKSGEPEGTGTYTWKNGQTYVGDWKGGKPNGQGTLKFSSGDRYEGTVVNGVPDQSGSFIWTNGDRYAGQWNAGRKHGQGTFTWANGDRWEGRYDNDAQTDSGTLTRKEP